MIKNSKTSEKALYAAPNCKCVSMRTRRSVLSTSPTEGYLRYGNEPGTVVGLEEAEDGYGDI